MVGLSSWQAQLRGKKTWSLIPPPECEHKCHAFNVTMNTGDVRKWREGGWGRGRREGGVGEEVGKEGGWGGEETLGWGGRQVGREGWDG